MHLFRTWLSAALAIGATAPAVADDKPAKPPEQPTLFGKMFGSKKPSGPAARAGTAAPGRPTVTAPLAPEVLADALRAEQEAYLRRVSVCCELRRVGAEGNDEALIRQADELERQAAALYNQRVTALGVPKVKASVPEPAGLGADFQQITAKSAAAKLTAPPVPTPVEGTASTTRTSDPIREVKP